MTLRGEWNGLIYAKHAIGDEFLFTDVQAKPEVTKVTNQYGTQNTIILNKLRNVNQLPNKLHAKAVVYGVTLLLLYFATKSTLLHHQNDGLNNANETKLNTVKKRVLSINNISSVKSIKEAGNLKPI
jgi:transposase-like protein